MKNKNLIPFIETGLIAIGEAVVCAITVLVFLIIGKLDYTVYLGVALGGGVTVLNFLFHAITTNRAIDGFLEARGDAEMTEEEAEAFALKNASRFQNAAKISFLVRIFSMLAALVVAFVSSEHFNIFATVVPLLMLRPIIMVENLFRKKAN